MTCPSCGCGSPPGSPLCADCGAPLAPPVAAAAVPRGGARHSASTVLVRSDEVRHVLVDAPAGVRVMYEEGEPAAVAAPAASRGPRPPAAPPSDDLRVLPRVVAPVPSADGARAALTLVVRDAFGEVADAIPIPVGRTYIGRTEGDLVFPEDRLMSPLHARIEVAADGRIRVRDLDSLNGTWLRRTGDILLDDGDRFMAGSYVFSYHEEWGDTGPTADGTERPAPPMRGLPHRVVAHGPGDAPLQVHMLDERLTLGREGRSPYQDDPRMARRHAEVGFTAEGAYLRDLSGGGLFTRLRAETLVVVGDVLILGGRSLMLKVPE